MTTEEELALLKSGTPAERAPMALGKLQDDAVAPIPQDAAAPATDAPVPGPDAAVSPPQKDDTFAANAEAPIEDKPAPAAVSPWSDDVAPPAKGLPRLPNTDAETWDILSAAWQAETIRTDAWGDTARRRDDLAWAMFDLLPKDAQSRINDQLYDRSGAPSLSFKDMVLAEVPAAAAKEPQIWGTMPHDRDAFDNQIDEGRRNDLDEAQAILDQPGGGFSEFIGSSARAMTDELSVLMMPLGLGGGAVRTILSEAALGALGEAAILPRETRVAQELDLPKPDAMSRILMGAALGGGLSAGVLGIVKGVGLMRARRTATRDAAMGEGNHLDAEIAIDRAEAELTGQQTPQQRMKDRVAANARPAKDVVIEYDLGGKTRDKPVSDAFQMSLQSAVAPLGDDIGVVITSGGQDPIGSGGKRKGSTRHDVDDTGHSQTADVVLTRNGRRVTPKEDPQLYADFLFNAGSRFPGIGHYDWGVHVGGGSVASWGPDTTSATLDPFFGDAIAAGRAGRSDWSASAPTNTPGLNYNEDATLDAIIGAESSGRASAANDKSSALGAGQYLAGTWLELVQRHRPDLFTGRSQNEVLALRGDAALSREMLKISAREGHDALTAAGLPAGPAEIYLTHFMGTTGATRALKADLEAPISSVMGRKQIADNASIRFNGKQFADFTVFDLRQWSRSKMRRAYGGAPTDAPNTKPTTRGYTGGSQITAGGQMRIDVDYEVVDIASLKNAAGDLQPRDRSQQNSTLQVQDIAARLDPAQLMPAPNAAYGTPIVGRDDIIDSGNGRTMGLALAYNQMPDRAAAYRGAIEKAGFVIPEGVTQPVLIARRKTDFTPEERTRFNELAQDSGVARMTAAEVSRVNRHAMTPATMGKFDLSARFNAPENDGWVRDVVAALPASERNAMFTDGKLNTVGRAQVREALFARAWPDRDILRRFLEDDPGELKSLMEALDEAAPSWAALRAEIEAGTVAPEMDISGHVLDAMRLIAEARDLARREKLSIASAVDELLNDVDILDGAVAPLTIALVRKFWKGGKAARADEVASFLTRYADDARKSAGGGLFDAPTPRDILRGLDPEGFATLPEDLGPVRGFAIKDVPAPPRMAEGYETGAASPEAEAASLAARDALEAPNMFDAPQMIEAGPLPAANTAAPELPDQAAPDFEASAARDGIAAARADLGDELTDMTFKLEDGTEVSFREVLDDLDLDANLAAAVRACAIGGK